MNKYILSELTLRELLANSQDMNELESCGVDN